MSKGRKNWPMPEGTKEVAVMRFKVYNYGRKIFHAELTVELPEPDKNATKYVSLAESGCTRDCAMVRLLQHMENTWWYQGRLEQGMRFKVEGEGMDFIYRGWL